MKLLPCDVASCGIYCNYIFNISIIIIIYFKLRLHQFPKQYLKFKSLLQSDLVLDRAWHLTGTSLFASEAYLSAELSGTRYLGGRLGVHRHHGTMCCRDILAWPQLGHSLALSSVSIGLAICQKSKQEQWPTYVCPFKRTVGPGIMGLTN